jgi:hypothetical protein
MSQLKVGVVERTVVQRINRVLAHDGRKLRKCQVTSRSYSTLGTWYMVEQNCVVATDLDLEELAKELRVLRPWEVLEEE